MDDIPELNRIDYKKLETYIYDLIDEEEDPHDEYTSGYLDGIKEFTSKLLKNLKENLND